jgi:hypothetical protein
MKKTLIQLSALGLLGLSIIYSGSIIKMGSQPAPKIQTDSVIIKFDKIKTEYLSNNERLSKYDSIISYTHVNNDTSRFSDYPRTSGYYTIIQENYKLYVYNTKYKCYDTIEAYYSNNKYIFGYRLKYDFKNFLPS